MKQILEDIKISICNDFLNAHDPDVGILRVEKIENWVVNEINESDDLKVISYDEKSILLDCESCKIEIFYNKLKEKWDARIVE